MSTYAWLITKDHLVEQFPEQGSDEGLTGPRDITREQEERLKKGEGHAFRMHDDDGELYYSGRLLGDRDDEIEGFAPLNDYGMPGAGCTTIQYHRNGKWETL
jgi:hypothetical protein